MKKFSYIIFLITISLLTSCGVGNGRFKLEGKFLNMGQGEFYVYSPDGGINGIDTIKVEGGRFTYECNCDDHFTLMLVFPNFSEQPIFAESGKSVDIKADASHLKELTVKGTKANELMNSFRENILHVSPPEEVKAAEQFINDHPESVVSIYLVKKYFIANQQPNYAKATSLLQLLAKEQPKEGNIQKLLKEIKYLNGLGIGKPLPAFTAYDVNGRMVSSAELNSAPVAVITTWASYNYDSQDTQRELQRRMRQVHGKLRLMSINLEGNKKSCIEALKRDSISWPNICSENLLEDKTVQLLGLTSIPDNIILQNGRIVARSLKKNELYNKLGQLLR